jgi:hypothetical protein
MSTPKQLVEAFINDYFAWNGRAYALEELETDDSGDAMDEAERTYAESIIKVYCRPGFSGEPISYGSDACHEPGKEIIVSEEIMESRTIIKTKHTGDFDFVSDYEYLFTRTDGRWFLESVNYIDADGAYPSL